VKLYVSEVSSARVRADVGRAIRVATSRVAYPEARAAMARRRRERALTAGGLLRAVSDLDRDFSSLVIVELAETLARRAGGLAEKHALRGFDAIHLTSALELQDLLGEPVTFLAFDARLTAAAVAAGLQV